jgi:diketogulonate reductase-like aldo/keto reductase
LADSNINRPATASGTFALGGQLEVHRLGYGAMRLTGPGVWGEPADRDEAIRVLRRAIDLGIDFIDTADSYGPYVSEELLKAALHPVPARHRHPGGPGPHRSGRLARRRPPHVPAPGV